MNNLLLTNQQLEFLKLLLLTYEYSDNEKTMGIKEARKKIDAFIKRYSLTMNEFLDLMDEHSFADETPTGKLTSTILTQSICDAHMTYMNSEGWSFIGGTVLWRKMNGERRNYW